MFTGLAIIFLIAVVIGAGVILSVRNVNVSFIGYSGVYDEEYKATRKNFDNLKGSGLLFIKDGDVYGKVTANEVFEVESYEKKYPCTINIVLRERVETFALKTDEGYDVYDGRGKLMREEQTENKNSVDGCPNVLLECAEDDIAGVAEICAQFKESFGAFRRMVKSVTADYTIPALRTLNINLYSGLKITLHNWDVSGAEKIKKAYEQYKNLSESDKISGTIFIAR